MIIMDLKFLIILRGVSITLREENRIELVSKTDTGGLLVLSEIYYKPGWIAKVNDIETPIYKQTIF